jgi:lysophospholipase L1-like esterase
MKDVWGRVSGTVRPGKRGWYGADGNWAVIPKPLDEPVIEVAGPNPANVLLIGDGPAMGYGVTAHDLALPGHLARQLSQLTGRGVTVSCIADDQLCMANIEQRFAVFAPAQLDVVIVNVGIADATHLGRLNRWTDRLHSFIRRVNQESAGGVSVVLVGIPPVATMPIVTGWRAALAERHSPLLNGELEFASMGYPNVEFLPFNPPPETDTSRYRSARTYGEWAWLISPVVAMSLDRQAHVSAWQRSPHLPSPDG